MNLIFLFSVVLKGLGAVLEILLQILITAKLQVEGYGIYSAWINSADLIFWVCFSGLVKCNTFYLSGGETTIRRFKTKYFLRYALPVLGAAAVLGLCFGSSAMLAFVPVITMLELLVMDRSSTLITRGQSMTSLVGEYVLGRLLLLLGVVVLGAMGKLSHPALLVLYVFQYCAVIGFFLLRQGRAKTYRDISGDVSLQKWSAYQRSDLMHSMIEQMPVVMQFFFSGAFEAGVVSVVLLVKKLINFISGPTAKIFLPEFSRLYHAGEQEKIRSVYGSIMRIQMLVVGPLAVVLLGFPRVILGILAEELVAYDWLFMGCSVIFLLVATLGPCGGILQMTGNEKTDNRIRFWALIGMGAVMLLTRADAYFVLYGLCVQVAAEAAAKYIYICRWMKRAPTGLLTYGTWWLLPGAAIGASYLLRCNDSFGMMVLFAGAVFAVSGLRELKDPENAFLKKRKGNAHDET